VSYKLKRQGASPSLSQTEYQNGPFLVFYHQLVSELWYTQSFWCYSRVVQAFYQTRGGQLEFLEISSTKTLDEFS